MPELKWKAIVQWKQNYHLKLHVTFKMATIVVSAKFEKWKI